MRTTSKTFDCVAFKRRAQKRLREEYEARKNEFASYVEFVNATVSESEWERQAWERAGRSGHSN